MLVTDAGDVYVTGPQTDNVFHVDPGGTVTQVLDASGDGLGNTLDRPAGLGLDSQGNLYVVGYQTWNVFKVAPGGAVSTIIDGTGDGLGNPLGYPWNLAVDAADDVFVLGVGTNNVFKIEPGGAITEVLDATGDGLGNAFEPVYSDMVLDPGGNLYVLGRYTNNAFRVAPTGTVTLLIDATGDGLGHTLADPVSIAVDGTGTAYVSGVSTNLFRIDAGGVVTFLEAFPSRIVRVVAEASSGTVYVQAEADVFRVVGDDLRLLLDDKVEGPPVPRYTGTHVEDGVLYVGTSIFPGPNRVLRVEALCEEAPRVGCHPLALSGTAKLVVKDLENDAKDLVSWKWVRGAATALADFGDPATLDYSMCLYGPLGGGPLFEGSAVAGASCSGESCWRIKGTTGFRYRDRALQRPDGMTAIALRAGEEGKAKVVVKGNRENLLDDLPLPVGDFPITAQLQASNGACWEASYSPAGVKGNSDTKFVAKSD